jgi:hypothetical protein
MKSAKLQHRRVCGLLERNQQGFQAQTNVIQSSTCAACGFGIFGVQATPRRVRWCFV